MEGREPRQSAPTSPRRRHTMSELDKANASDTRTLAGLRRLVVGAMRTNPKVDRAVRALCVELHAEGLVDYSSDELRETLRDLYSGKTTYPNMKRASCVAAFDELASLHCIDTEREWANEDQTALLDSLRECGVQLPEVL